MTEIRLTIWYGKYPIIYKNWTKGQSQSNLVGGWTNPFEKYARQIGSFPQFSGWK